MSAFYFSVSVRDGRRVYASMNLVSSIEAVRAQLHDAIDAWVDEELAVWIGTESWVGFPPVTIEASR